jgi:tRNA A-37 threonylcarbamoyl transferase component Bud32
MKKIVLLVGLTLGALHAQNIVHYDTKDVKISKDTQNSIKPNYPNDDIYPSK